MTFNNNYNKKRTEYKKCYCSRVILYTRLTLIHLLLVQVQSKSVCQVLLLEPSLFVPVATILLFFTHILDLIHDFQQSSSLTWHWRLYSTFLCCHNPSQIPSLRSKVLSLKLKLDLGVTLECKIPNSTIATTFTPSAPTFVCIQNKSNPQFHSGLWQCWV